MIEVSLRLQTFALDHIALIEHFKNLVDFVEGELEPQLET
jgi:hypothetical protein